jgi:hypothetical protein
MPPGIEGMALDNTEHRHQRGRFYVMLACTGVLFAFAPTTVSHDPVRPQHTAAAGPNPFVEHALPTRERRWLSGTVDERLAAGPYVYLRLREADGSEAWIVSLKATTPKETQVRALVLGQADHFHSARLKRDFDPLIFAAVRGQPP